MITLRIYDLDRGFLALDLRHLLDLLSPRSLQASWVISTVKCLGTGWEWFEATGETREALESLAQDDSVLTGRDMVQLAKNTRQVIWGKFTGMFPVASDEAWVTIQAIDSTFYEVTSADERVLSKIRSTYKDVRPADRPYD